MDRLNQSAYKDLEGICPGGVFRDVDLSAISQWRIGGKADVIIQPSTTEEVLALRQWFAEREIHHVVIGLTSNLLFADEGLHVPCIQIGGRMASVEIHGTQVTAQSGVWVPGLARKLMQAALTGAEHTCGIPGTLGGLVCMNGGSQRKGIGSNVLRVESVDVNGRVLERAAGQCGFAYRQSIYQNNVEVITTVDLQLDRGDRGLIRREMLEILSSRRRKFPRKQPNCGSVFKSNPAMYSEIGPPGAAIERLGFKGKRIGGALVSPGHANFIVNTGSATARDVLDLTRKISESVERNTGFRMEAEACFVTVTGTILPADKL